MKYIPSLLIYSTFLALCYFGVTEFENAKSLFLSQMTLNMIICGFFLLGLFLEIRTLSILSQAETWFEDPKANKTPKILGHIKSYLEPYLSEAKTQKSKYTLNFSDFQSIQIYLFTQFSMKNRNTQSILIDWQYVFTRYAYPHLYFTICFTR